MIEQKTEKKISHIEKYEYIPYIQKSNGELILYEKQSIHNNINNSTKMMENIIAVNFVSLDYDIHYPIPCKKTDIFEKIENKLYQEYPILKTKKIYFLGGGGFVNKNLSDVYYFSCINETNLVSNGYIPIGYGTSSKTYNYLVSSLQGIKEIAKQKKIEVISSGHLIIWLKKEKV